MPGSAKPTERRSRGLAAGRRIYDWWADNESLYRAMAGAILLGRDATLRNEAVAQLHLENGNTVLDLACGPGTNLARLERAVGPGGRIIAFDYNTGMLSRTREAAAREEWRNVDAVQGDAAHMRLPDDSLDGALCTLGLSAMPQPELAIRQVHRCLKPEGRLVVLDAKLAEGTWSVFNPLLRAAFVPTTNWNTSADLIVAMRDAFGSVAGRKLNRGTVFLAVAKKEANGSARREAAPASADPLPQR